MSLWRDCLCGEILFLWRDFVFVKRLWSCGEIWSFGEILSLWRVFFILVERISSHEEMLSLWRDFDVVDFVLVESFCPCGEICLCEEIQFSCRDVISMERF